VGYERHSASSGAGSRALGHDDQSSLASAFARQKASCTSSATRVLLWRKQPRHVPGLMRCSPCVFPPIDEVQRLEKQEEAQRQAEQAAAAAAEGSHVEQHGEEGRELTEEAVGDAERVSGCACGALFAARRMAPPPHPAPACSRPGARALGPRAAAGQPGGTSCSGASAGGTAAGGLPRGKVMLAAAVEATGRC
jgi:hypothetical protein